MIIKVNYTVSDVYMSTSISPVYIKVVYSGVSGGGGTWGTITGTLSNQTDLQTALDNKVPYTGATGPVNLGAYDLTVNSLTVGRGLGDNINNTVVGSQAGAAFTTAQTNVAIGEQALKVHSTGNANTAVGRYAMLSDVDGEFNTALGTSALVFLASGVNTGNTAIGVNGLGRLTSGSYNTWLGYTSAPNGILTSGSFNTIIGGQVNVGVATLNNNIIIADGQGNIRFRDDATSTILSRLAGTGTRMVISDANGALSTQAITSGTVTSVGLSMPNAFGVANSPVTSSGTLAVTALGSASQYIRGDGELATLPTGGSGGSAVSYYLNGGTAASVGTYFQMSQIAVIGTNADFTKTGNGLVSQFLTDVGDPNRLQIPAGNWNFEMFFSMSSSGGTPQFYVELLKYDGTTFTSIASSSAIPETISSGTAIDLYLTSLAIPATTLLTTDRLALRVYIVNNSGGRTATLHTQDSHLCQIITNFAGGVSALNGLTANTQYFATGTSGTNFAIVSSGDTHTFNLPTASATNRGALSSADWTTFNSKQEALTLTTTGTSGAATLVGATLNIPQYSGGGGGSMAIGGGITSATAGSVLFAGTSGVLQQDNANFFWDDTNNRLGIGTATPTARLDIQGTTATDGGQLGSELTTTGSGTNWAGSGFATGYTHATGSTAALTTTLAAIAGSYYQLSWIITGRTAGVAIISYGGIGIDNVISSGSTGQKATATTSLRITPNNEFDGTIILSIKIITAGSPLIILRNSAGIVTNEFRIGNNVNTFIGLNTGSRSTTSVENVFIGKDAGLNITSGNNNIGIGSNALSNSTNVFGNVAIGGNALLNHTNVINGTVAIGFNALKNNTTGSFNTAAGWNALQANSTGSENTAFGTDAMQTYNSSFSSAFGYRALQVGGNGNSAFGNFALGDLSSGTNNSGFGYESLGRVTSGSNNTAIGRLSGKFISGGVTNNTISNNSIFIGFDTRALASNQTNQIVIGYQETGLGSNTTIIGNSSTITTALRGRLILGTTTDTGLYRLDVNGTARVSGKLSITAGTTAASQINLASSTAPTTPNDGDIWFDGTNLLMRIGGVTKTFTLI